MRVKHTGYTDFLFRRKKNRCSFFFFLLIWHVPRPGMAGRGVASSRVTCANWVCARSDGVSLFRDEPQGKYVWLCTTCAAFFRQGRFCPFCQQIYRQGDGDNFDGKAWLECSECVRWCHVSCDAQFGFRAALKIYADSQHGFAVLYVCPDCRRTRDRRQPHGWGQQQPHSTMLEMKPSVVSAPMATSAKVSDRSGANANLAAPKATAAHSVQMPAQPPRGPPPGKAEAASAPLSAPALAVATILPDQGKSETAQLSIMSQPIPAPPAPNSHDFSALLGLAAEAEAAHAPKHATSHRTVAPTPTVHSTRRAHTSTKTTSKRQESGTAASKNGALPASELRTTSKFVTSPDGKPFSKISRWIRCQKPSCRRWRRIHNRVPFESIPSGWVCADNRWDKAERRTCSMEMESAEGETILNAIEACDAYEREKMRFYTHLAEFMRYIGMTITRNPTLGGKDLDLYRLYREVVDRGGCDAVIKQEGSWARIFRGLPNFTPRATDASYRLKRYYLDYLYAYEQHFFFEKPLSEITVPVPPILHRRLQAAAQLIRDTKTQSAAPASATSTTHPSAQPKSVTALERLSQHTPQHTPPRKRQRRSTNGQTSEGGSGQVHKSSVAFDDDGEAVGVSKPGDGSTSQIQSS